MEGITVTRRLRFPVQFISVMQYYTYNALICDHLVSANEVFAELHLELSTASFRVDIRDCLLFKQESNRLLGGQCHSQPVLPSSRSEAP